MNRLLVPWNVHIGTLTAERVELARLADLERIGHFKEPAFPILPQFLSCDYRPLLEAVGEVKPSMVRFLSPARNGDYSLHNEYFTSPDAEVAYVLVKRLRPDRIVEIGSGHSTRLFRAGIRAEALPTKLICVDPHPRVDVASAGDQIIKDQVERLPDSFFPDLLSPGDFLFIDSSHEIRAGNDVLHLFLRVLPRLKSGVVIHLHDIFLPYDYPSDIVIGRRWENWKEQYLVQALLQDSDAYEVLWPGYYLQRTVPNFGEYFAEGPRGIALSLWLRKRPTRAGVE